MTAPIWVRAPNTGQDPAEVDGTEAVEVVLVVLVLVTGGVVEGGVVGGAVVDLVVVVVVNVVVVVVVGEGVGRWLGLGLGIGRGAGLGDGLGDGLGVGLWIGSSALLGAGSDTEGDEVGSSAKEIGPGGKSEEAGGSATDELVDTTTGAAWTCCLRWINTPTSTPRVTATATADATPSAHRCCIGRPPLVPAAGRRDLLPLARA